MKNVVGVVVLSCDDWCTVHEQVLKKCVGRCITQYLIRDNHYVTQYTARDRHSVTQYMTRDNQYVAQFMTNYTYYVTVM